MSDLEIPHLTPGTPQDDKPIGPGPLTNPPDHLPDADLPEPGHPDLPDNSGLPPDPREEPHDRHDQPDPSAFDPPRPPSPFESGPPSEPPTPDTDKSSDSNSGSTSEGSEPQPSDLSAPEGSSLECGSDDIQPEGNKGDIAGEGSQSKM